MVYLDNYKGCESLNLENEYLKVVVLPSQGGKIASIFKKDKKFELLFQNKSNSYAKARLYDTFEESDVSGFDDAFPTIDACKVSFGSKDVEYPDHGEVWTMNFDYRYNNGGVSLWSESAILPYKYEKSLRLDGNGILLHYNITNTGEDDFPCLWAMHCLVNCEKDMKLMFPEGTAEVLNVLNSRYLGNVGTIHKFPVTQLPNGSTYKLDEILPEDSNNCEKYYVNGKVHNGVCGVYYPSCDTTFKVIFDKEKLPYLGFWIIEGGFRGEYNCAMEPTNGFFDSIEKARENNSLYTLKSRDNLEFSLKMELY